MAFFDKGKGQDKDKKPAEVLGGDKESFSLFKKKPAEAGGDKPGEGRFLTLVKGKGAQAEPAAPDLRQAPALEEPVSPVVPPATTVPTPPTPPTSGSSPLFSLKRRPADPTPDKLTEANLPATVPPVAAEPAPATEHAAGPVKHAGKGWLGRLFTRAPHTKRTEASPREGKVVKPRRSAKVPLGASKDFHVYIQLENAKEFFWSITANHIQEVDRKKVLRAASFSRDDIALHAGKALGYKGAEDLALQEIGEPVHIVNRTRDLATVYATAEDRALTSTFRLFPGQQALDRLLKDAKVAGKPVIAGFVFATQDGKPALAILYYVNADGLSSRPQITLNPDNMEFVLSQFAASRKINKKDAEILLYNNADFLGQVGGLQAYPDERVWKGIPLSTVVRASAAAALLGAGALAGWAGVTYLQVMRLESSISTLDAQSEQHRQQASSLVSHSLLGFAKVMSLEEEHSFALAQQLWQPGERLSLTGDLGMNKYVIRIPVVKNKMFNNHPSVDATPPPEVVQSALNREAPQGCSKDNTAVSGNLNEIQITVVCQNPDTGLSGYRID